MDAKDKNIHSDNKKVLKIDLTTTATPVSPAASHSNPSDCRKHIEEIKSERCYISMDDASNVEIDYKEHDDYLKHGIPQHLAQEKLDPTLHHPIDSDIENAVHDDRAAAGASAVQTSSRTSSTSEH